MEIEIELIKKIDAALDSYKASKRDLAQYWCLLNAKVTGLTAKETHDVMAVIEENILMDDLLAAWAEYQNIPQSMRPDYQKKYMKRRKEIIRKLLI